MGPDGGGRRRRRHRLWAPDREDVVRELDEEIGLHLELRAETLVRGGMPQAAARAESERRFGLGPGTRSGLVVAAMRRERRMRIRSMLDGLKSDVWQTLRAVRREPGLSLVIVVTLALGIGANAVMFGLIDRLLLRGPEHVADADALYRLYRTEHVSGQGNTSASVGYVSYTTVRDGTRSFDGVAAYRRVTGTVGRGATAEPAAVAAATADFYPLLGVAARVGRFPSESEDRPPMGEPVVTLGYDLWQRRFGGDPGVLGETLVVDDEAFTIIGVAPRGFTGVELWPVDVWIPMSVASRNVTQNWPSSWGAQWMQVVARLKPDVSAASAGEDVTAAHAAAYTGTDPRMATATVSVRPLHYSRQGREPLEVIVSRWLLVVAALVLLIACANVANLLLARSMRRRREVAVRLALGIGRGRLLRLLVLHGLVLAAMGGVAGLVIVGVAGPVARSVLLPDIAWTIPPVDSHTLLFTALLAVAAGAFISLVPALRSTRGDLTRDLKAGVREGGGRRSLVRSGLVLAQVTLTFVLLVGSGLFARSLSTVENLDLGIEPDRVLQVSVRWAEPASSAAPGTEEGWAAERARRSTFHAAALERVRVMPGVGSAAVAIGTPFRSAFTLTVLASGHDSIPSMPGDGPYVAAVTSGFFEVTGLELLDGRTFTTADRAGSEPVAIVNRTMASTLWPGGALDECLYIVEGNPDPPCQRVVGVVEDARRYGLREPPAMQYYIPLGQEAGIGGELLLIRSAGRPDDPALVDAVRTALIDLEPGLSFVDAGLLQEEVDPQVRPWRLGATLFTLFGALALAIASIGLYSVIAYMVADRTHEVGVRKALGADAATVLRMMLRQGLSVVAVGIVIGCGLALLAGRFIQPALFETSARDPVVFAAVALVTAIAALSATFVPAWRAGRVDPVRALRAD